MAASVIVFPAKGIKPNGLEDQLAQVRHEIEVWADRVVELTKDLSAAKSALDLNVKILEIKVGRVERA